MNIYIPMWAVNIIVGTIIFFIGMYVGYNKL